MQDFERQIDEIELHRETDPRRIAFLEGKRAGRIQAKKEFAALMIIVLFVVGIGFVCRFGL